MPRTGPKYIWLMVYSGIVPTALPRTPPNPLSSSLPVDVYHLENQVKALASALHDKDQNIAELRDRLREKDATIARLAKNWAEKNLQTDQDEGNDLNLIILCYVKKLGVKKVYVF